jgi:hypothetical protein
VRGSAGYFGLCVYLISTAFHSGTLPKLCHLESNYYWQCQQTAKDLPGQCDPANHPGFPPSFSFLSGYQGLQSDPNELFVILEVPGDAIPHNKRW